MAGRNSIKLTSLVKMKMGSRYVIVFSSACLFLVITQAKGTLTPSGTVSLDCGSQQTFICSVTGTVAGWNITGLSGISAWGLSGQVAANINARIINTDTGDLLTSTITITGFSTADNGGTVQCIELISATAQGITTMFVGPPSCLTLTILTRNTDFTAATVTWSQPSNSPPVPTTTVTYCPTSSPNCGNSTTCTSPCTISGLDPCVNYSVTVTPSNNCGSATGCMMNRVDSLSQSIPGCPRDINVVEGDLCDSVNVTWTSSPSQTSATITYCQMSPQGSCMSVVCSSSPCTIQGVRRDREYEYTVLPANNCGSASGCTGNTFTFALAKCNVCTTHQSVASIIPTVVAAVVIFITMLLLNIISVVVVFFLTRHCYWNTSKTSSPVKREDVYEQVQGGKTYEHITMTDSPAYGPVK